MTRDDADRVLSTRIQALEVRPGDSIVLRIHGLADLILSSESDYLKWMGFFRAQFDAAGILAPLIFLDAEDGIDVVRSLP